MKAMLSAVDKLLALSEEFTANNADFREAWLVVRELVDLAKTQKRRSLDLKVNWRGLYDSVAVEESPYPGEYNVLMRLKQNSLISAEGYFAEVIDSLRDLPRMPSSDCPSSMRHLCQAYVSLGKAIEHEYWDYWAEECGMDRNQVHTEEIINALLDKVGDSGPRLMGRVGRR